jgi:hypothetical protein
MTAFIALAPPDQCPQTALRRPYRIQGRIGAKSEFDLLGYGKGVIDLDAEIADGAFELGVPEQQLHRSQVAGLSVNLRHLGAAHRVGSIS